jgi:hypothetical protein
MDTAVNKNRQSGFFLSARAGLAVVLIVLCPILPALSPPPPQPDDVLLPLLYDALDGEQWRRSDGWLDPEVHWCDWYGVVCREQEGSGDFEFYALDLADNALSGEITPELADWLAVAGPTGRLDLSHNAIEGVLHELPITTGWVRLDFNRIGGELPALREEWNVERLAYLELNNNRFEGPVPASWERLELLELDVSNNRLDGGVENAFEALDPAWSQFIDLSDNPLSGELPAWINELELEPEFPLIGSIDLCWTDLTVPDPATGDWLAERHVGGSGFEPCLERARRALGPEVSGSWFDPARSGEGFSLMLLEDGTPLVYWFTHLSQARQMWLIGSGQRTDTTLFFDDLLRTQGVFGEGFGSVDDAISSKGEQRMDGVDSGRLHLASRIGYNTTEFNLASDDIVIFMPNPVDIRTDLVRLSELAGTTCDNQSAFQQYSGAWYDPERAGEGFIVEVLPDDRVIVYWFTYQPAPSNDQAWLIGQGHIGPGQDTCLAPGCEPPDADLVIDEMLRPVDTGETFPADLTGVEGLDWGELRITFDDGIGYVYFESTDEAFGSGDYAIERLARPMLAECPQGADG